MGKARRKVILKSNLQSWDEVNESLRRIAEKQSYLDAVISKYNEAEARRRKALDEKVNPIKKEIADMELDLNLYCEEHKEEFGKKKSKELSNGIVGFRLGMPKLKTLKGFTWKAVLELIKRSVFKDDYIRTKEEVAKDKIIQDALTKQIDEDVLDTMGVQVMQDEAFYYEPRIATENLEKSA